MIVSAPHRRPRAVLLDFGDTLMREGPVDLRAGAEGVLRLARDTGGCDATRLTDAVASLLGDLNPRRRSCHLELPPDTFARLIYEPLGVRFAHPAAEVEWAFWSAATSWSVEPGARGMLDRLRELGLPCGVLSNTITSGATVARHLAGAGLLDGVAWVMTSADYVLRKPHPRLFELAARRLGAAPADTWFVGDSYENDVCGAAAAGMVPVWFGARAGSASGTTEPAAYVVSDWDRFLELLAETMV